MPDKEGSQGSQEADSMPPRTMSKGSIVDLVKDLLAKVNQAEIKSKKKFIEWGDESDEEDEEGLIGETKGSKEEVDQDNKMFL